MSAAELVAAVRAGDVERVRALVAADPALASSAGEDGMPVVRVALYHRQAAALDALLAAGPALADADVAAVGDVPELRRRLAAKPGLVRERTPDGFTPLHYAAFFGGAAAVEVLLSADADPDVEVEGSRLRPLHSAAAARDRDAARLLLEAGADPDARQQGGFTALHAAAQHDDAELAALLLRHGADPSIRTEAGADAAAIAREQGAASVLAVLGA